MKFCPKAFGQDMRIKENLAYCRSIQDRDMCEKCVHYDPTVTRAPVPGKTKKTDTTTKQDRLF